MVIGKYGSLILGFDFESRFKNIESQCGYQAACLLRIMVFISQ